MTSAFADSASLAPRAAILLVEDEPVLRASMVRGLAKLANVNILVATTVAEAVALVRSTSPSLVISDIDLPGATGLDLISDLHRLGIDIPIILITAYLETFWTQIPKHPNVLVLEKPIPLEVLRSRVTQLVGSDRPVRSSRPPLPSSPRPIPDEVPLNSGGADTFESLWAQGVDAILSRKLDIAASFFRSADQLRPNEPRITANLQRLKELGYDQIRRD